MTILFAGGEDSDFTRLGEASVSTATTVRRTAYARCALAVTGASTASGWIGTLSQAATEFWLTARFQGSADINSSLGDLSSGAILELRNGATSRLVLRTNGGSSAGSTAPSKYRLTKYNSAGTATNLADSSVELIVKDSPSKLDVYVKYAVAGRVIVYLDGTPIIDYSGDVTTDGVTSLTGFLLGHVVWTLGTVPYYWSEVIAATTDTRGYSLNTVPPAANGNAFQWAGSTADIAETTLDDATAISSALAGQVAESTVSTTLLAGSPGVVGVVVAARAQKGTTGPQNADLLVRTSGADYASADIALPPALDRISAVWDVNPATGSPWTAAEIQAAGFNIGIKSVT